jgi:hypothetical protein
MRKVFITAIASMLPLALWAVGAASPAGATHSHFRYGHYTWVPGAGNDIVFTVQNGWRRTANSCVDVSTNQYTSCSAPDGYPAVGDVIVEDTGGTVFDPGDGSPVIGSPLGPLYYLVTSIDPDPAEDWLTGSALDPNSLPAIDTSITHTYPAPGNYVAFTDSCCRIGTLVNATGSYRVETIVNVGTGNRSPVSALPPIVNCPVDAQCSFSVPGSDPDSDTLTFRFSTPSESGIPNQPGPPFAPNAATIDPNTGQYNWDTTGAGGAGSLYASQVTIEDRDATGSLKSKVAVDFIIKLVTVQGAAPVFDSPPTPACGTTHTVRLGRTITFTVQASDADAGQTVTLNASGVPAGATHTPPLPTSGNPASTTFSWTPTRAQVGTHVISYSAVDDVGQQALCAQQIRVRKTSRPS